MRAIEQIDRTSVGSRQNFFVGFECPTSKSRAIISSRSTDARRFKPSRDESSHIIESRLNGFCLRRMDSGATAVSEADLSDLGASGAEASSSGWSFSSTSLVIVVNGAGLSCLARPGGCFVSMGGSDEFEAVALSCLLDLRK